MLLISFHSFFSLIRTLVLVFFCSGCLSALFALEIDPLSAQESLILSETDISLSKKALESFVEYYECSSTGKFTHEYHPFMLEQTAESFRLLEKGVADAGFRLNGRMILLGYEEQGLPDYFPDFAVATLSDEMTPLKREGWTLGMHNRFGTVTGFLTKDVNNINARFAAAGEPPFPLTHIHADQIALFDNYRTVFQEHALGDAYELACSLYEKTCDAISEKNTEKLFSILNTFWHEIYQRQCKMSGKQHLGGTQDILFSLAYLSHIRRSPLPLIQMITGPDITYPIEETSAHAASVTRHAQACLEQFVTYLTPRNGKKTAYIFGSFVDGVGKSTMLGNIMNWQKFGNNVAAYQHVDNASSQAATLYHFADKVCIVDLPAQVSHYTYKPDGYVYADIRACNNLPVPATELIEHVKAEQLSFESAYEAALRDQKLRVIYDEKSRLFIDTLCKLQRESKNRWVPFQYKSESYLFSRDDLTDIRWCCALEGAPSHGLKNTAPEQMIFNKGVRFPLSFSTFLEGLCSQMREAGVEEVVFVDFLSMYSRSSRENIRVNYLLQLMASLYGDFSIQETFYQDFVETEQVLALLDNPVVRDRFRVQFERESLVRTALFSFLQSRLSFDTNEPISFEKVIEEIGPRIDMLLAAFGEHFADLAAQKIDSAHKKLFDTYGKTRDYLAYYSFNPAALAEYSQRVFVPFMARLVATPDIAQLWALLDEQHLVTYQYHDGAIGSGILENGTEVAIVGEISPQTLTKQAYDFAARTLRANWYCAASNLLYTEGRDDDGRYKVRSVFGVIPSAVIAADDGRLFVVQPEFPGCAVSEKECPDYRRFEVFDTHKRLLQAIPLAAQESGGEGAAQRPVLADWGNIQTAYQVYSYAHAERKPEGEAQHHWSLVSKLVSLYYDQHSTHEAIPLGELARFAIDRENPRTNAALQVVRARAAKYGVYPEPLTLVPPAEFDEYGYEIPGKEQKVYWGRPGQAEGAAAAAHLLAQVSQLCQDRNADLLLRPHNQDDFRAARAFFEQSTIACCFGLTFQEALSFTAIEAECERLLESTAK